MTLLVEPECVKRNCKHFVGVNKDANGRPFVVCAAFPTGIPKEISYGTNKHLTPYPGDNGIQYEKAADDDR